MRVADLLHKHGLTGTFYVPRRVAPGGCCNPDGFDVMDPQQMRELGSSFEIGSHTLDHKSLNGLPPDEAKRQIEAGKAWLEDQLGRQVDGFCYPNGHHDAGVRALVRDCGFTYGRTTEDLYDDVGDDPFQMPVSLQFHPRRRRIDVARLFFREERRRFREKRWMRRLPVFAAALSTDDFEGRFRRLVDRTCAKGGVFHMWGHSWEIDRLGAWSLLEDVLRYAAERVPRAARVTNDALMTGGAHGSRLQPAA